MGSFQPWCNLVGGIVEFIGYRSFLGNSRSLVADADLEEVAIGTFVGLWYEKHHEGEVRVVDLVSLAALTENFPLGLSDYTPHQTIVLGKLMPRLKDRVLNVDVFGESLKVQIRLVGQKQRTNYWRLRRVDLDESGGGGDSNNTHGNKTKNSARPKTARDNTTTTAQESGQSAVKQLGKPGVELLKLMADLEKDRLDSRGP